MSNEKMEVKKYLANRQIHGAKAAAVLITILIVLGEMLFNCWIFSLLWTAVTFYHNGIILVMLCVGLLFGLVKSVIKAMNTMIATISIYSKGRNYGL